MMMTRRCAGGQEQQPLWRRRHLVVRSTIRILSRTTIRTPGCKRRNTQTPAPFRRRGKGHICEKSAFVGISRARILWVCCVLCSLVCVEELVFARGKTLSKETTFKKLLSRRSMELRTYESVSLTQNLALRVLLSNSDASVSCTSRVSNQLFQKRRERYDIWERLMKLFHYIHY